MQFQKHCAQQQSLRNNKHQLFPTHPLVNKKGLCEGRTTVIVGVEHNQTRDACCIHAGLYLSHRRHCITQTTPQLFNRTVNNNKRNGEGLVLGIEIAEPPPIPIPPPAYGLPLPPTTPKFSRKTQSCSTLLDTRLQSVHCVTLFSICFWR